MQGRPRIALMQVPPNSGHHETEQEKEQERGPNFRKSRAMGGNWTLEMIPGLESSSAGDMFA